MSDTAPMPSTTAAAPDRDDSLAILLYAANRGDQAACARFLHEVAVPLRTVIAAHAADLSHTAQEEILQETLTVLHRERHTWSETAPLRPWLCSLARYGITASLRRHGRTVSLRPADFSGLLLTAADYAAADLAFGAMRHTEILRPIMDSLAATEEGLRRLLRAPRNPGR